MKRIIILIIISLAISTAIFFINSNVIQSAWSDKMYEVIFIAIPVFIVVSILYYANRSIIKRVRGGQKNKPSV
jgi:ABC-type arginine transport system permease subunit